MYRQVSRCLHKNTVAMNDIIKTAIHKNIPDLIEIIKNGNKERCLQMINKKLAEIELNKFSVLEIKFLIEKDLIKTPN